MVVIATVGHDRTVRFFNNLLHGLDVGPIILKNISPGDALIGVLEVLILGWLVGACIAGIYNLTLSRSVKP